MTFKIVYLNGETGELGRLPDNGIINSGGVSGSTFTVGGKALIFADGTLSDGSSGGPALSITLQNAYDSSLDGTINLSSGKDFIINALNQKIFQVEASTGKVTITGDLTVLGSSTVVEGTLANVDQISINPPNATTSGLLMEPMVGVTMNADLVRIRAVNSGPSVFTIDASGNTSLKQLTVSGTVNGINLNQFYSDFQNHLTSLTAHTAEQITVDDSAFANIIGADVQTALESIDSQLGIIAPAVVETYEHIQIVGQTLWSISHNKNLMRAHVAIYDTSFVQIFADEVKIIDANTVNVTFNSPQSGRAFILLF